MMSAAERRPPTLVRSMGPVKQRSRLRYDDRGIAPDDRVPRARHWTGAANSLTMTLSALRTRRDARDDLEELAGRAGPQKAGRTTRLKRGSSGGATHLVSIASTPGS